MVHQIAVYISINIAGYYIQNMISESNSAWHAWTVLLSFFRFSFFFIEKYTAQNISDQISPPLKYSNQQCLQRISSHQTQQHSNFINFHKLLSNGKGYVLIWILQRKRNDSNMWFTNLSVSLDETSTTIYYQ